VHNQKSNVSVCIKMCWSPTPISMCVSYHPCCVVGCYVGVNTKMVVHLVVYQRLILEPHLMDISDQRNRRKLVPLIFTAYRSISSSCLALLHPNSLSSRPTFLMKWNGPVDGISQAKFYPAYFGKFYEVLHQCRLFWWGKAEDSIFVIWWCRDS